MRLLKTSLVAGIMLAGVANAQTHKPPAASSLRTAPQAAAALRRLFFLEEMNDGAALGDTLARRFPRDGHVLAWYVASLVRTGQQARAESLAARIDTMSRDPWLIAARSMSRTYASPPSRANFADGGRLAFKARSLAPRDSDIAWFVVSSFDTPGFPLDNATEVMSYIDSVAPTVGYPAALRLRRAQSLYQSASGSLRASIQSANAPPDTGKRNAAMRELAALRVAEPSNVGVLFGASNYYRFNQPDTALAILEQAVALAPRSAMIRRVYWMTIDAQRSVQPNEKRAMIVADRTAFLAVTDSAAWAMSEVLAMQRLAPDSSLSILEERILARAPKSQWAETVLSRRASQWRDSLYAARDTTRPGPKSDTLVVKQRYFDAIEAFIDKKWVANPATRNQAILDLFFVVRDDPTYPTPKMVALVKHVLEPGVTGAPSFKYAEAARILAERKVEFPLAEKAAREGLTKTAKYVRDFPGYFFSSVGEQAETLDGANATLHDNLGLVFYHAARFAEADSEISRALDLNKKSADIYRHLGQLRVAQGRDEDAEIAFAQGMTLRYRGVNPNQKELEAIYKKNHGTLEGWSSYLGALMEKEKKVRRDKILATRDTTNKPVAPFKLNDLANHRVDSDSLRSKYTVVNFWGTWCGPCVAEMPELQQFYDKYRNDASVAIMTISNDKDLQMLKEWVDKRKLTVPTLFDDGYVANTAQIHVFPTTWFISPDGHVEFSAIGNTGALVEEWTWRLEAMKGRPANGKAVP